MNLTIIPATHTQPRVRPRRALTQLLLPLLLLLTTQLTAAPWITPGNIWLRADIEYLADRNIIKAPITTYPIMWSGIKKDLDRALQPENINKLNQREQDTLIRLKRAFRQATKKSSSVTLKLASDTEVLRGFADTLREEAELAFSKSDMGDEWAYELNVQYVNDPYDGDDTRLDGSYLATIYDNFSIGYGYVDKWWGPGWDSSLILSNNARSTPGIMVQRNYSDPFESEWLSWIGPWTINIFANVLDDERHITDAKLLGISITFKPFDSLEIGLRRTAQWGGEGRIESFGSLIDMALGRDNCGSGGIDACGTANSNEPGNQLGAIDFRWRLPTEHPMSVYFQMMGEDEAGYLPSRKSHLVGFTSDFTAWEIPFKYFAEYSDTAANFGEFYNTTYNHSIYQTGYRYHGRSIASTYDNDTKSFVIGTILSLSTDRQLFVQLSDIDMNVDNAGKHTINTSSVNFTLISALYRQNLKYGQLDLYLNQYSDIIDENKRQENETRLGTTWKMTFN